MKSDNKNENQIDSKTKNASIKESKHYLTLRKLLDDPETALRLGFFDAGRQQYINAFVDWEKEELGCTKDMIRGFNNVLHTIEEELSLEVINVIRKNTFTSAYGLYNDTNKVTLIATTETHMFELLNVPGEDYVATKKRINKDADNLQRKYNLKTPPYSVAMNKQGVCCIKGASINKKGAPNEYCRAVINNYNNEIKNAKTDETKKLCIIELIRELERIHPYLDFNCRTFGVLILNRELIRNNLAPALLDNPNVIDNYLNNQLLAEIQKGQENLDSLSTLKTIHKDAPTNEQWRNYILDMIENYNTKKNEINQLFNIKSIPNVIDYLLTLENTTDDILELFNKIKQQQQHFPINIYIACKKNYPTTLNLSKMNLNIMIF